MQQAEKTLLVSAAALQRLGFSRLEQVLEYRAEKYRGDQQDGGEQRTTQGFLIILPHPDQIDRRHHDHQQDRPVPESGENSQGLLQRWLLEPLRQGSVANQVSHRTTQADHQQAKDDRRKQPGEHCDAAGDIAAQLPGDLRAGQCVTQRGEEADQE